jgi:hypothetical protein
VWYKSPPGLWVSSDCLPYSWSGLGAFPQFPKGEILLNKTEREREGRPESSTIGRPWWGVSPGKQTPPACQTLMVTFLGSLSQFGTTYTNLGSEEIGSLCVSPKCYMLVSRVLAFTGQRTGSWGSWMTIQSRYIKQDLWERKGRLQLRYCSGAQKPVACCTGEGLGFYGHFNSGLGGFFSLAMDSRAFSGKLVWLAPLLGEGNSLFF